MINRITLLLFIVLLVGFGCVKKPSDDLLKIKQLIIHDYETLSNVDIEGHKSNVTDDYILIEDGHIWDLKDEIEYLFKPTNIKRKNEFEFLNIDINSKQGVAIYKLISTFDDNGQISTKEWSESVVCKKINGNWKISLLHSTPVREEQHHE